MAIVSKSPKDRVVNPFQMAELHGLSIGVILTTYESCDGPLSIQQFHFVRNVICEFGWNC